MVEFSKSSSIVAHAAFGGVRLSSDDTVVLCAHDFYLFRHIVPYDNTVWT